MANHGTPAMVRSTTFRGDPHGDSHGILRYVSPSHGTPHDIYHGDSYGYPDGTRRDML